MKLELIRNYDDEIRDIPRKLGAKMALLGYTEAQRMLIEERYADEIGELLHRAKRFPFAC